MKRIGQRLQTLLKALPGAIHQDSHHERLLTKPNAREAPGARSDSLRRTSIPLARLVRTWNESVCPKRNNLVEGQSAYPLAVERWR